jgi:adenylate cyclase
MAEQAVDSSLTTGSAPSKAAPKRGRRSRRKRVDAELLLAVSNRMAAIATLNEQLEALVEITVEATAAERGTLFLNDGASGELYSRVALGDRTREIRMLNSTGIAGHVFTSGRGLIVEDPYHDSRFNRSVDEMTGFVTRDLVSAPIRTVKGEVIGVAQCLNKREGKFTQDDLLLLEAMTMQASVVLQGTLLIAQTERLRRQESKILDLVADVSSEIQLGPLLQKIMSAVTKMLDSDRSTLFLNDEKTGELYTEIGQGLGATKIHMPNSAGIAGTVFTTGQSVNIPYAYADLRFNPSFDRKTGYFTRSILCVPVLNKDGKTIGVTQVLNKRGGPFTDDDETRLRAFTAQISIGLENAKLFDDVQKMKNYNQGMLESMSNGVVTFDGDGVIVTCNAAAQRIIGCTAEQVVGQAAEQFFSNGNTWVAEKLARVRESRTSEVTMDAELECAGEPRSVNLTVQPLDSGEEKQGAMMLIEDISNEKRVKATMARYMDPALADQLLGSGEEILGGQSREAIILFSDIRSFTTLTEELGAQGTVSLLNDYFTLMVDCIDREGGILDKFIGDAIMAVFGAPIAHEDDNDRAVRAGIAMLQDLARYNQQRSSHGLKPIHMGIGVNTGMVVTGNIGSPKRMDYTVIGDGVNLAARLESACKQYGARFLISEFTVRNLKGTYRTRQVDRLIVKGKTEPVGVYEILDYHTAETFPSMSGVLNAFRDGLGAYREGRWDPAVECFREALEMHPGDQASKLYLQRCELLKANPPADWDGVWVMTTK